MLRILFSIAILLLALSACGQKGPLHLPEHEKPKQQQSK